MQIPYKNSCNLTSDFTIRLLGDNPFKIGDMTWRAGQIVRAMEGCNVHSIIDALTALEEDTGRSGKGTPSRWLTHFAGMESKASGKACTPWLIIINGQNTVRTIEEFKSLLG